MKPELNSALRMRFFGAYWGTEIQTGGKEKHLPYSIMPIATYGFIELRPVSALADDEAIEVERLSNLLPGKSMEGRLGKWLLRHMEEDMFTGFEWINVIDYLRSIGVALPFMGHSVEDLVEAGWIKLVQ